MNRPLYHLLYTNAPGDGGTGFRHVPVSFPESADPTPVQKWLETVHLVSSGANEGWAFNSFGLNRTPFAALAVVNPGFSLEDHGRGRTVLAHALLLSLDEREAVGQFGRALYDQAKKFLDDSRNEPQVSLDSYLNGCRALSSLEVREAEPRELCHLEARFLQALYHAASLPVQAVQLPGVATPEDVPEQILWAGAALPPRLRLLLRWCVGLQSGGDGFVARPGEGEGGDLRSKGVVFHEWLQQALRERRFDVVRQVSENWEIRDWERLVEASPKLAGTPVSAAVAEQLDVPEETEMAKKRSVAGDDKPPAPRSRKSAETYDEEYQSLQKNLEEYVDRRLASLRGGDGPPTPGYPVGARSRRGFPAWFKARRPEIYLVAVLLILVWLHRPPVPPQYLNGGDNPTTTDLPTDKPEETSPPEESPESQPQEEWESFVNQHKELVGGWFRAGAEHRGLEAKQVKAPIKQKFLDWADALGKGKKLPTESITGLFEYIHAWWAKANRLDDPNQDQVTLNPDEVQRNLPALLTELDLTDKLGDDAKATDLNVQVAVVRAWLERQSPPEK